MTEDQRSFFGIRVEGEVADHYYGKPKPQLPGSELAALLHKFWNVNAKHANVIEQLVWTQYTPYFNDGDPCVFGVGEVRFYFSEDHAPPQADLDYHDGYGFTTYNEPFENRVPVPVQEIYKEVEAAIEGGSYDDALYEAFGDHAEVTAYADRFTVSRYEHD